MRKEGTDNMEKRIIRSGAPFVMAGAAVLLMALLMGIGSVFSYVIATAVFALAFSAGRKLFPARVIEVERAPQSGNAQVDALISEARVQLDAIAEANDAIAEDVIAEDVLSSQIEDIETTCRTILARLEEQPHQPAEHCRYRPHLRTHPGHPVWTHRIHHHPHRQHHRRCNARLFLRHDLPA